MLQINIRIQSLTFCAYLTKKGDDKYTRYIIKLTTDIALI